MENKELKNLIEEEKSKSYFDGFSDGAESKKELSDLLLIGLTQIKSAETLEQAQQICRYFLIKSEKFRNA